MSSKGHGSRLGTVIAVAAMFVLTAPRMEAAAQEEARTGGEWPGNVGAWEVQAKTVAKGLGISGEQTEKLVDAYRTARNSQTTAANAVSGPAERPDEEKMREVNRIERAKFKAVLDGFLNPEQVDAVLLTLGSFFRRWDGMVEVLEAMDLADKPREEALKLTADYVAEWNKAMQALMASGGRESMRELANELKDKLDREMSEFLSAEQMVIWADATGKR